MPKDKSSRKHNKAPQDHPKNAGKYQRGHQSKSPSPYIPRFNLNVGIEIECLPVLYNYPKEKSNTIRQKTFTTIKNELNEELGGSNIQLRVQGLSDSKTYDSWEIAYDPSVQGKIHNGKCWACLAANVARQATLGIVLVQC
jgi:hypothetical protein